MENLLYIELEQVVQFIRNYAIYKGMHDILTKLFTDVITSRFLPTQTDYSCLQNLSCNGDSFSMLTRHFLWKLLLGGWQEWQQVKPKLHLEVSVAHPNSKRVSPVGTYSFLIPDKCPGGFIICKSASHASYSASNGSHTNHSRLLFTSVAPHGLKNPIF